MLSIQDYEERVEKLITEDIPIEHVVTHDIKWLIDQYRKYANGLFTFAKFQVGERIKLRIDVFGNHKWDAYATHHFLIKGAKGRIHSQDYDPKRFHYWVSFDDESWKDREGKVHPTTNPHVYHFYEEDLEAA